MPDMMNGCVIMCKKAIRKIREKYSKIRSEALDTRLDAMSEYANDLLEDGDIPSDPPIPIVEIAEKMGFRVFKGKLSRPGLSGMIAIDSDLKDDPTYQTDRLVFVNDETPYWDRRFIIAHELAHYLFDFNEDRQVTYYDTFDANEASSDKEQIANRFAAELLMPRDAFTADFKALFGNENQPSTISETISILMEKYVMPSPAVKKRIMELDLLEQRPELADSLRAAIEAEQRQAAK